MQRHVNQRKILSVDELNWCGLEQSVFDEAINQWQERLRACFRGKEGRFKYSL